MAISETTLKDVMLMLIDEQNKKGGLLGKKLEAVVVDPASNWPLFAEKARELITKDKVAATFGCWTSVSRKSVLPVFKELNSLLFYPVQYEGEESERNVFYTGAAPNQQAIPAVDYLMKEEKVKRWVLAGTDYVYPRTTNKILEAYLKSKGVKPEDIMINYTPFGHSDWQTIVADIKKFGSAGKKTAVVSTINGDANVPFYKELGNQGIKATDIPVVAFSVGEEELAGIDTEAARRPPRRLELLPEHRHAGERRVHQEVEGLHQERQARHQRPDGGARHRLQHVGEGGREGRHAPIPTRCIDAIVGIKVPNLTGGTSEMLANHHITKPVFIGEIQDDGQFDVVWKTEALVPGDDWSDHLDGSKDLKADWVQLKCGNFNTKTDKCGGRLVASTASSTEAAERPPPFLSRTLCKSMRLLQTVQVACWPASCSSRPSPARARTLSTMRSSTSPATRLTTRKRGSNPWRRRVMRPPRTCLRRSSPTGCSRVPPTKPCSIAMPPGRFMTQRPAPPSRATPRP